MSKFTKADTQETDRHEYASAGHTIYPVIRFTVLFLGGGGKEGTKTTGRSKNNYVNKN